jgi:DNA polymerase-3 subunit gamma/tau
MKDMLYQKYQPTNFANMVGSSKDIKALNNMCITRTLPKVMLFYGPQGTGKSLSANIIAFAVNCTSTKKTVPCMECESCKALMENPGIAITKINGSSARGIDDIRSIVDKFSDSNIYGFVKVFIIEEFEPTKDAQKAFKEPLSTLPDDVVVILTTNEIEKIIGPVLDRCQQYQFGSITVPDAIKLITHVAEKEGIHITKDQITKIIEVTDQRRPRYLIQTLQSFRDKGDEAILSDPMETVNTSISRILNMLVYKNSEATKMSEIIDDINEYLNDNEPQALRMIILTTIKNILMNPIRLKKMSNSTRENFLSIRYPIINQYMIPELSYTASSADIISRLFNIILSIRKST